MSHAFHFNLIQYQKSPNQPKKKKMEFDLPQTLKLLSVFGEKDGNAKFNDVRQILIIKVILSLLA